MRRQIFLIACFCLALFGCDSGSGPIPAAVEMKGGMAENSFTDVTFAGTGLRRFEGRKVEIRVGGPVPLFYPRERTAYGRARVSEGSFSVEFPGGREVGLYKPFALFIDADGNGKCTPGRDMEFQGATGGGIDPYVCRVEEALLFPAEIATCQFMEAPWMD